MIQPKNDTRVRSNAQSLAPFVWTIAEILRGDFKQSEYGKVILPFVVMRRLDCILEASKDAVLKAAKGMPKNVDDPTKDMILFGAGDSGFSRPRDVTHRPVDREEDRPHRIVGGKARSHYFTLRNSGATAFVQAMC